MGEIDLVSEYKKLYNQIPHLKSESSIRRNQRKMRKLRKELVEKHCWTWEEANNIME